MGGWAPTKVPPKEKKKISFYTPSSSVMDILNTRNKKFPVYSHQCINEIEEGH